MLTSLGLTRDFHPLNNTHAERTKKAVHPQRIAPLFDDDMLLSNTQRC